MNDRPQSSRMSGEVQAALIAGAFGIITIVLTQWDNMPWSGAPQKSETASQNTIAPTSNASAAVPDREGGAEEAAEEQPVTTRSWPGYRDAPGAESAPQLLRLYARAVARLAVNGNPRCTAFLVSENLALTASYCIPDEGGTISLQFDETSQPVNARLIESSGAVNDVSQGLPDEISYALLRLDGRPGAERGWLPLTSVSPSVGGALRVIGGAVQRTIGQCATVWLGTNMMEHGCDPGMGGGGAPILSAEARVVGVHAFGNATRHFAVRADRLLERSRALRSLTSSE